MTAKQSPRKRPGRPPNGDRAMTPAEKQRVYRQRQKARIQELEALAASITD